MGMDPGELVNVMMGACESSLPITTILFSEIGKERDLQEAIKRMEMLETRRHGSCEIV